MDYSTISQNLRRMAFAQQSMVEAADAFDALQSIEDVTRAATAARDQAIAERDVVQSEFADLKAQHAAFCAEHVLAMEAAKAATEKQIGDAQATADSIVAGANARAQEIVADADKQAADALAKKQAEVAAAQAELDALNKMVQDAKADEQDTVEQVRAAQAQLDSIRAAIAAIAKA